MWSPLPEPEPYFRPYTFVGIALGAALYLVAPPKLWLFGVAVTLGDVVARQLSEPYRFAMSGEHRLSQSEFASQNPPAPTSTGAASTKVVASGGYTIRPVEPGGGIHTTVPH